MKQFFLLVFSLSFSNLALADSFEIQKNGKTYLCTETGSGTAVPTSLSGLCNFAKKGRGQTLYYSSGAVFTHSVGTKGATWYYDNGSVMTHSAGTKGATWYYKSGAVLTHSAGTVGATWYYKNGSVMTHSAGTQGATWYYENGSVMTYSGPAMTSDELLYGCDYVQ